MGDLEEDAGASVSEATQKLKAWRRINWPGVIAGALTIALPFLGTWWRITFGMDALTVKLSPFGVETSIFGASIFGEAISSPLLWWFLLGLKLGVVYLGVLLLMGSVLSVSNRHAAIAELFVRFSARKLLWLVVAFVAMLFIVTVFANMFSEILELSFFQLRLPPLMVIGEGEVSAGLEVMRLSSKIYMGFTREFAVAVLAVALGIVSRIYQKKLL